MKDLPACAYCKNVRFKGIKYSALRHVSYTFQCTKGYKCTSFCCPKIEPKK